jgi:sugar-specific transcriptional regulator TrmB
VREIETNLKWALKMLSRFGLSEVDALIYIYLEKKGPQKGNALAYTLNLTKIQLDLGLKNLIDKGMTIAIGERSTIYSAVPLEKVLEEFLNAAEEQARTFQSSREELLSTWRSIREDER